MLFDEREERCVFRVMLLIAPGLCSGHMAAIAKGVPPSPLPKFADFSFRVADAPAEMTDAPPGPLAHATRTSSSTAGP